MAGERWDVVCPVDLPKKSDPKDPSSTPVRSYLDHPVWCPGWRSRIVVEGRGSPVSGPRQDGPGIDLDVHEVDSGTYEIENLKELDRKQHIDLRPVQSTAQVFNGPQVNGIQENATPISNYSMWLRWSRNRTNQSGMS